MTIEEKEKEYLLKLATEKLAVEVGSEIWYDVYALIRFIKYYLPGFYSDFCVDTIEYPGRSGGMDIIVEDVRDATTWRVRLDSLKYAWSFSDRIVILLPPEDDHLENFIDELSQIPCVKDFLLDYLEVSQVLYGSNAKNLNGLMLFTDLDLLKTFISPNKDYYLNIIL